MKLGIYVITHANPYDAATTWVVWGNSQFATLRFLTVSFFCSFISLHRPTVRPILKSYEVFRPRTCLLGSSPKTTKSGLNRHFSAKPAKIKNLISGAVEVSRLNFALMQSAGPPLPRSYRWSSYVTRKSHKGWHKKRFFIFKYNSITNEKSLLQSFVVDGKTSSGNQTDIRSTTTTTAPKLYNHSPI